MSGSSSPAPLTTARSCSGSRTPSRRRGVGDRVELIARWISEEEKADLLSRCAGLMYIPFDEDSYGYPTLEAYHSGKPVLSCTDSGGTREIVEDGVTGLMTAPDA